ncbi:kinase-like protein [Linnemannia elongata AG-77]|uniref:Kinase-like protein n=1 Tax=Linnemannia elongata AG-77 TaxID=1314771 RepID=A0A197JNU7_9FUNG|nr:kinase-like protein [Linnemannia elongata AG-77]
MADITNTIVNLVASINRAASRARVNKTSCFYLSLKCDAVLERVENGEFGSMTDPRMKELVATLGACRADLTKFSGLGFVMRLLKSGSIPEINNEHSKNLDLWLSVASEGLSEKELREEIRGAIMFKKGVTRHQKEGIAILKSDTSVQVSEVPIVFIADLDIRKEVGKFPFGTIYTGFLKDKDGSSKPVYIRELSTELTGADLRLVWTSIRLSRCLVDCQNVIFVHGICQGRMIVTDTTTHGPLNELTIMDDRQKVAIARKVADALMSIHDVAAGNDCIVHRDIRAANILIDQGSEVDAEMEPKITGFEMCKQSTSRTGNYPDIDKGYRRWWSPERTDNYGTSTKSDVFAFGVLMYEISTGKEPEDGDPVKMVKMEGMRICSQYTTLMERCLDFHYDARPSIFQVAKDLLAIENILMGDVREP